MSKRRKKPAVKKPDDEYQVTEAEVIKFFDSMLVCTCEEWLAVLADGQKYQNQVKGLTAEQRRNVKRFAKMMQNSH